MRTIVQLKDICTIAPPKSEVNSRNLKGKMVSFLPMEDLSIGIKRIVPPKSRSIEDVAGSYTYFAEGDILLAKVTPCFENGKLGIATDLTNGIGFGSSEFIVVRPNSEKIVPAYLYYRLQEDGFRKKGRSLMTGACGLKRLPKSFVANTSVYLPSLPEQQRIVDFLDQEFAKIDALKANAEKSLQAAKDLFQATLKKELEPKEGWSNVRMDEICHITAELIDPTQPEYLHQIHIGGANIETETGVLLDLKTAEEEKLISGKFPFDETMVLYSKIRPYLKKICCPNFQGICSADIYPLTPLPGIDRTYLYYILLSQDFTDYAILGSARAGMPKVNRPYLFAYSCSIPGYEEQCSIANRLDIIRKKTIILQENYGKTLALCDDLKQALLRKAFNGEL